MAGRDFGRRDQHLRSPSSKPTRADCRHGEFFRDFWQAVYGERKGVRGGRRHRGMRGTTVCTAAGRWVRSVSTVRELDRASGPLVGPMPTRLCTYTDRHKRAAASCIRAQTPSLECTLCGRARATGPVCACSTRALARALRECACASDTLPVSQCVRQERCIALRRCVKASENTCSLGLFTRLVPSFSRRHTLRGPSLLARRAPSPRLAFPFLRFSHSAERSPPSRPRTPFLPRAILHFDCIAATAREKTSMKNECRETLTRIVM